MAVEQYRDQVRLLLDILPLVIAEPDFALKGGTAINLFEWDLPRLSVDIDLTYLPIQDRATSLASIGAALARIGQEIEQRFAQTRVTQPRQGNDDMEVKLHCQRGRAQVKVEVNPVLRGHFLPTRQLACSKQVQERFEAFVEARCLSHGELFGGKICAALDRQHPRDLFDVRLLLDQGGLTDEVRYGMITGLVSHRRPIAELIRPAIKDQRAKFDTQFTGMAFKPFTYVDHEATLIELLEHIQTTLTDNDRQLLQSFEAGDPDWQLFPFAKIAELPGAQFKLQNVRAFRHRQPARHEAGLVALERALGLKT